MRLNNVGESSQTILLGIPYPQIANFYLDFDDRGNDGVLNKKAFGADNGLHVLRRFLAVAGVPQRFDH